MIRYVSYSQIIDTTDMLQYDREPYNKVCEEVKVIILGHLL